MTDSRRPARGNGSRINGLLGALGIVGALAFVACSSATDNAGARTHTTTVLASWSRGVGARPAGPFVTVLDSVDLVVTSPDNATLVHTGQRLRGYDSTASLSIDAPAGANTLTARILSRTGATVFSGSIPHSSTAAHDTLVMPMLAMRPALLVAHDTLRTSIVTSSQFSIFNAGANGLAWSVIGIDTAFTRCSTQCIVSPPSGQLGAGQTATMRVSVPANFPSRLFSFVLHSTEGDVVARWQYAVSPIVSVAIQPSVTLAHVGRTVSLNPVVQSGSASPALTWTSSSPAVATVNASGAVTGVSAATARVTATSTIDTAKKATADVRVYDSVATVAGWSLTAPASAVTVNRDGTGAAATVAVAAQISGPSSTFTNPYTTVEFWVRPVAGGTWTRFATSGAPTFANVGTTRTYTWSVTWNPTATDAPFANPSTTPVSILALGIRSTGQTAPTLPNTQVTVRVP